MLMKVNAVVSKDGAQRQLTLNAFQITHFHECQIPRKIATQFPKLGTMVFFGQMGIPIDMTLEEFEIAWTEALNGCR